ncbi:MAG TPA: TA system VapC family ribonuclease toxin [Mycobacteriales bacterium]|nr:TA system VapC family ribonuclease toxin [Mycobacteriales bacterium]
MIAVDANLLIYAYVTDYGQHRAAHDWLEGQLVHAPRVGLPWASLLAFLRLVTNPRVFPEPASFADAWAQVQSWLSADSAWIPVPGDRHDRILGDYLGMPGLRANDVPDAHLAALAVEHGLTLATNDAGFARFPALRWSDPLRTG